jgi:hypothetical protein
LADKQVYHLAFFCFKRRLAILKGQGIARSVMPDYRADLNDRTSKSGALYLSSWMFITPEGHGYAALGAKLVGKFMAGQHAELLHRFVGNASRADAGLTRTKRRRLSHVRGIRVPFEVE